MTGVQTCALPISQGHAGAAMNWSIYAQGPQDNLLRVELGKESFVAQLYAFWGGSGVPHPKDPEELKRLPRGRAYGAGHGGSSGAYLVVSPDGALFAWSRDEITRVYPGMERPTGRAWTEDDWAGTLILLKKENEDA